MSVSTQHDLLIEKLIEKLYDSDARTRRNAAGALGMIGARALGAIPILSALLSDNDPSVRAAAERTLDHLRFAYHHPG
jgi:HEAT repeat protein